MSCAITVTGVVYRLRDIRTCVSLQYDVLVHLPTERYTAPSKLYMNVFVHHTTQVSYLIFI